MSERGNFTSQKIIRAAVTQVGYVSVGIKIVFLTYLSGKPAQALYGFPDKLEGLMDLRHSDVRLIS